MTKKTYLIAKGKKTKSDNKYVIQELKSYIISQIESVVSIFRLTNFFDIYSNLKINFL